MEDFTDTDYLHEERVCKYLKIKKIKRISRFACSKQYIIVN